MRGPLWAAIVIAATACPAIVAADTLSDIASATERAIAEGRTIDALDLADRFGEAVRAAVPLAVRRAVLVENEPASFGAEQPRADAIYDVDEEIHLYVEPIAFGWVRAADGWQTDIVADVRVASPDGRIIAAHKDFAVFNVTAAEPIRDVFLAVTYVFGGLGPGDYVATTTLHDRTDGDAAAFSTPFTIR